VLPGTVAGWVPWVYYGTGLALFDTSRPLYWLGLAVLLVGLTILFACIFEFARSGKGTLSPADPPKHLVVQGLYRYARNPMYIGVVTTLIGESILVRTSAMATYAMIVFIGFNIWVKIYEEPWLARTFGNDWTRYKAAVPMWIPRLKPFSAESRSDSD
jgi:protein-S-isoprenylcysteine O-methyltransferase Ste14